MFKANNEDTRTTSWRHSGVFVNFENILYLFPAFLLETLDRLMFAVKNLFLTYNLNMIFLSIQKKYEIDA